MATILIKDVRLSSRAYYSYAEQPADPVNDPQPRIDATIVDLYTSNQISSSVVNSTTLTLGRGRTYSAQPVMSSARVEEVTVTADFILIPSSSPSTQTPPQTQTSIPSSPSAGLSIFGNQSASSIIEATRAYRDFNESFTAENIEKRNQIYDTLVRGSTKQDKRTIIKSSVSNYSRTTRRF